MNAVDTVPVLDILAIAKEWDLIEAERPYTFPELRRLVATLWETHDAAAEAEAIADRRAEEFYESNWPGADQYRAEEEADRARAAFLSLTYPV